MYQKNINLPNLGLIAGGGVLPKQIANIYSNQGGNVYIAALEQETNIELIKDFQYKTFKIGNIGKVIDYFKSNEVKDIVFIGSIKRPNFKSIQVDFDGAKLIAKILKQKIVGDDQLLKIVAKFFEEKGFNVISVEDIIKIEIQDDIFHTTKKPSKQDLIDIEIGVNVLKALSPFDVGQGVIVHNGYVIGIEAAEGTDQLIKRCGSLRNDSSGGVFVKMMKIGQDNRLDVPVIGPETIENLAILSYNGIAIEKAKVILIDHDNLIKLANKYGIFISYCNI